MQSGENKNAAASSPADLQRQSPLDGVMAEAFPGDTDEMLRNIQVLLHFDLMRYLAMRARKRYLEAIDFLGIEDELATWLRPVHYVDPLALMKTFGLMAAAYRFNHPEHRQVELGQSEGEHWEAVKSAWVKAFTAEVEEVTQDGRFVRAMLEACRRRGSSLGQDYADRVLELFEGRYGDLRRRVEQMNRQGPAEP